MPCTRYRIWRPMIIVLIFARISQTKSATTTTDTASTKPPSILIRLNPDRRQDGHPLADSIRNIRLVLTGEIIRRPARSALIAAAAISIVAKEVLYRYTVRVGRQTDSPSVVEANAWHHRSDALSSIGTPDRYRARSIFWRQVAVADPLWPSSFRFHLQDRVRSAAKRPRRTARTCPSRRKLSRRY